eukprot:jgi/Chrzof1/10049/Cz04g25100.t1
MNIHPSGSADSANIVAIGSMEPGIEIWDLDVVDHVEPAGVLGGYVSPKAALDSTPTEAADSLSRADKKKAAKHKRKKSKKARPSLHAGSHEDAVLGLSWNREYRNVLASASADGTVKVWDVVTGQCEHTLTHHKDKVQAVAWNPAESPVLLTGSFDRTACLVGDGTPHGCVAGQQQPR